ncbi:MAG TPA: WD40 repeat domain-containing protein [Phototrophicaceae bacterium]|nr:WD40 repeat domain-containing protein [Phototrophicaceae bacterium]
MIFRKLRLWFVLILILILAQRHYASAQDNIRIASIAWNKDSSKLALGYDDGTVEIIDPTGKSLTTFHLNEYIAEVEWSPTDTNRLAVAANIYNPDIIGNTVSIINTAIQPAQAETILDGARGVNSIEWRSDGTEIAAAINVIDPVMGREYSEVRIWNASSGVLVNTTYLSITGTIDWLTGSNKIAAETAESGVLLWDLSNNQITPVYEPDEFEILFSIAWSEDGIYLAAGSGGSGINLQILNLVTGQRQILASDGNNVATVAWSCDGRLAAFYPIAEQIKIYAGETGAELQSFAVDRNVVLAWNSDGTRFVYGSNKTNIQFLSMTSQLLPTHIPTAPVLPEADNQEKPYAASKCEFGL